MKTSIIKFGLLSILFCLPVLAWGAGGNVTKEKTEHFSFKQIKADESLQMTLDFGNITILPWDKNEIRLDSKVTVVAENARSANEALELRKVTAEHSGDKYVLKFAPFQNKRNKVKKVVAEWTVRVPKDKLHVFVANTFGKVSLPETYHCQSLRMSVKHGPVFIDELVVNEPSKISIEFGDLDIVSVNKVSVVSRFGMVNIGKSDSMSLDCEHCKSVNLGDVGDLKLRAKFSEGRIMREVKQAGMDLEFATINVNSVVKELRLLSCLHSKLTIDSMNEGLVCTNGKCQFSTVTAAAANPRSFIRFNIPGAGFSTISLKIPKTLNARYSISNTFGDIDIDMPIKSDGVKSRSDNTTRFEGYIGTSANTAKEIKITNQHGSIKIYN